MEWYIPIIAALSGVVLGWGMQEGSRIIKDKWSGGKKRTAINEELNSIYRQIPFVIDIIRKAVNNLDNGRCLPCQHTHFTTRAYYSYINELYKEYNAKERDCLHIIYERLRTADEILDSHLSDLMRDLNAKSMTDPIIAHKGILMDTASSLATLVELIVSFLQERPIDVFPIERKIPA